MMWNSAERLRQQSDLFCLAICPTGETLGPATLADKSGVQGFYSARRIIISVPILITVFETLWLI
jgi:hypothetical protein